MREKMIDFVKISRTRVRAEEPWPQTFTDAGWLLNIAIEIKSAWEAKVCFQLSFITEEASAQHTYILVRSGS